MNTISTARIIGILEKEIRELEKSKGSKESKDPKNQEKLDSALKWLAELEKKCKTSCNWEDCKPSFCI